jgi:putative oxidoreductase
MQFQRYLPLVARTFLAIIFVRAGVTKIIGFAETQQQITEAGIPLSPLVTILTILIEVLGGIAIILGYRARTAATILFLFLIPTTLVFHNPLIDPTQTGQFFKNLSIMGGLLLVSTYGAGPVSVDTRINPAEASAPPSSSEYASSGPPH